MHITLVKKIGADGEPCRKCVQVEQRLNVAGLTESIDRIVVADEREPAGDGMRLARKYQVDSAPFFIVEMDDGETRIYTIYFRFVKEILRARADTTEPEKATDILNSHPELANL